MTTIRSTTPVSVAVETVRPRMTATPPTRRFRDAVESGAGVVLDGVEAAASLVPGGSAVSAAIRGGRGGAAASLSASAGGSESAEGPGAGPAGVGGSPTGSGSMDEMLRANADQNLYFLQLQESVSAENRRYTALSNVLKARHETAKSSINNIR